jgi:DNA-binding transcriptional ArsR family regulator
MPVESYEVTRMTEPHPEPVERLAEVLRALAEPVRLRMLAALAETPLTGTELAARFDLAPATVSHHLARLTRVGLVRWDQEGHARRFRLDPGAMPALVRDAAPAPAATPAAEDEDRERAAVLRAFMDGAGLRSIPAQRRKRVIVLQHLLERFTPGRDYPEREVNAVLRAAHPDVATLRRELVDYGFMTRAHGVYRVADAPPARSRQVAQEIPGDEAAWLRGLVTGATAHALGG